MYVDGKLIALSPGSRGVIEAPRRTAQKKWRSANWRGAVEGAAPADRKTHVDVTPATVHNRKNNNRTT